MAGGSVSACGTLNPDLTLADRVFTCPCGHRADRDLNAAVDLAAWPALHRKDPSRSPGPPSRGPGYQCPPTGRH
ncbi:zinc ribbon domain-containing protein [Nocardia sp. NPDC002869]|uniref:zinc ribbon domain-containing protein n=1 Tax=Nocardia sp. NPDC002869 TaxID=3161032 RepID=UPI00398CC8DC